MCDLADGLQTRKGSLGTEVAAGREGDCLPAGAEGLKGASGVAPGPCTKRPSSAPLLGKVCMLKRKQYQRCGVGACSWKKEQL